MFARLAPVLAIIIATGCAGALPTSQARQELNAGLSDYESGKYREAEKSLQFAVNEGLFFKDDEIRARKYLAFIHCASARQTKCRNEFKRILDLDPEFELTIAEAGHPAWGPVFRKLKAQTSGNRE
ncbi:MAG: TssQ family T6SS-associated lipoprotein [Burkholderiales bacterium]